LDPTKIISPHHKKTLCKMAALIPDENKSRSNRNPMFVEEENAAGCHPGPVAPTAA